MADEAETHEQRVKRELKEQAEQRERFLEDSKRHDEALANGKAEAKAKPPKGGPKPDDTGSGDSPVTT